MSDLDQKQADAEQALAEVQQAHREAELAASTERTAQTGYPVNTPEGEVLIVSKIADASGVTLVDADGNEYEQQNGTTNVYVKVGRVMTEAETEDVQENGVEPPPVPEGDEA